MSKEMTNYNLGIPKSLYTRISEAAEEDHTSKARIMIRALQFAMTLRGRDVYIEDENGELQKIMIL